VAVLVDTGVIVGALSTTDPHHGRARGLLKELASGKRGALLATDHVLAEGLALLRRRPGDERLSKAFAEACVGTSPRFRMQWTDEAAMREAVALHFKHYARGLSLVDCTLVAHAQRLGAPVATLDGQFQGLVDIVA
jgi:predicted nucleic acid-binding protein